MSDKKNLAIANFNCTFGMKNEPMMNYFDNIIYPAFISKAVREVDNENYYFFDEIKLLEYDKEKYVLTGVFIKSTTLEVKSRYLEGTGLKRLNEKFKSDPFSVFIIFLENHRMVLVKNQKGSPDIRSFSATASYVLRNYIHKKNIEKYKLRSLPFARLNVVSIPSKKGIIEKLQDVSKIKKVIFKIYPTNGDIPISGAYDSLIGQLEIIGSKTGNVTYNSPKYHSKVAELITETRGIVDPSLSVEYKNGGSGRLTNETFSENINIKLSEEVDLEQNIKEIIEFAKDNQDVKDCSKENKVIYMKNFHKIKNILNR